MFADWVDRLANILEAVRSRLWLIPALVVVGAAVAARLLAGIDAAIAGASGVGAWWYFGADAETARDLLATLLSGMITMAALVISITMVVLSVAASQLGPRLIWSFIRDRQIQAVIGLFFGTIVFVLVVMRSIRDERVPDVAVSIAVGLVALCLFALLFHIHKVARSIIADTMVEEVADELTAAIDAVPDRGGASLPPVDGTYRATLLAVGRAGYVQVVEYHRLARIAQKHGLYLVVRVRAGQYLLAAGEHLEVRHRGALDPGLAGSIRNGVVIGAQRTPTQDLEYSVRQLVEIGVRALSPGINDPFTAITVVHRLAGAIELLMARDPPDEVRIQDDEGVTRVTGFRETFGGVVDAAYNQIRQSAVRGGSVAVMLALVSVLGQLGLAARNAAQRSVVRNHLEKIARSAAPALGEPHDRADFEAALADAERLLATREGE